MRMMVCGVAWSVALSAAGEESISPDAVESADKMFNAVVKLEVVMSRANPSLPWQNINESGDGSGVVIGNGRILTCAHCVTDATYIRIRKNSEDSIYKGAVEFIDNDCDLALVKVPDPVFMRDITPMQIGVTPVEQARVLAVGYPLGGRGVAFTEGVVSRIEDRQYTHSLKSLLTVQVDAAINPGNSGGPVLDMESGRICGIAFQGDKRGGPWLSDPPISSIIFCGMSKMAWSMASATGSPRNGLRARRLVGSMECPTDKRVSASIMSHGTLARILLRKGTFCLKSTDSRWPTTALSESAATGDVRTSSRSR